MKYLLLTIGLLPISFVFAQNLGNDCSINTASLIANGAYDIKATIIPDGTTASNAQPGEGISASFDENLMAIYHSSWNNTVFPVILNYQLDGTTPIDYIKYTPRQDGGTNGNFGAIEIS